MFRKLFCLLMFLAASSHQFDEIILLIRNIGGGGLIDLMVVLNQAC